MKRTTILADERLLAEVSALARRKGVTTTHIVREALERYVTEEQGEDDGLPTFVGMFSWEGEPTSATVDDYLEQNYARDLKADLERDA